MRSEVDHRAAKMIDRQLPCSNNIFQVKLTPYAWETMMDKQLQKASEAEVFEQETGFKVGRQSYVSPEQCQCSFFNSNGLPCRHILAERKKLSLPLYAKSLVPQRWTKDYYIRHSRVSSANVSSSSLVNTAYSFKL